MRHTVPKNLWTKALFQMRKTEDQRALQILTYTKITTSPAGDTILWDPEFELLESLKKHLTTERAFARRECTREKFDDQIARLNKLLDEAVQDVK